MEKLEQVEEKLEQASEQPQIETKLPKLSKLQVFGVKTGKKPDLVFPSEEDFEQLKLTKNTKLSAISWRNNDVLKAIKLHF